MDLQSTLESIGYAGIFISVFIESGVIFGLVLPLPGFSLVFTTSVLAATTGRFNIYAIIITAIAACVLGYIVGYETGRRYGPNLFSEKNKKVFTPEHAAKAQKFMKKYGYPTLIIGRFLPFLHSATPLLSGFAKTPYIPFTILNIIGAIMWSLTAALLGYFVGDTIPHAEYLAIPFIILIFALARVPAVRRLLQKLDEKIESS